MRARLRVLVVALAAAMLSVGPRRSDAEEGSLADDGRVGVVADMQGTVLVRPAGRTRWSPVGPRSVLLPGDEVRTLARGANVAEIRLAQGGSLVLGPGGLASLDSRERLRLLDGDAEVAGAAGKPIVVAGPGAFETSVEKATVLRADVGGRAGGAGPATTKLAEPPRWLTGYRGSTTDEWMGSLLANVDGRNVPLTVGYHKVGVTIRDQIAETTIEESFVNSTDSTLEGVFSFPLPADASISGFGMWIGDELVMADIVERGRAREIYEDIRSRRKDPGLLEWSGGNLFKASVFPIFGRSEKRIKLRYTQVLPLEGSTVRYRYALRSELLRTHPLRELQIHVAAQSATPIVAASSPTHEVRVVKTADTATVDFSASQYTPSADFEVVLQLETSSALRVVPHRRGDDGYFMLLLAPPDASAGAWKRDLVPEGGPLDVLFVADTSGSMGPAERRAQRAFIEASLALLSDKDRFRLMACDSGVVWLAQEALPATDANAARALESLDRRTSLGWSDLDAALAAAVGAASDKTLVVYVGDGVTTTGDADPVAFAQRIARMKPPAGASFHAVAPGSSYEKGVLEAIAAHGGAVRNVGDDPARTAFELLAEAAQPSVKDLRVEFEGLRTARVYPEKLPNLAAGAQQIVMGRFLPEGAQEQRGRVKVTGTLDGKPVAYSADVVIAPGAEGEGNTFLPRLWARRHLDALLAQGRTPAIKDEVVAMSESYGIITPYTSFLVLENDEDRERYGVARRVAMRDGERFFTDARTTAATAALRAEMQKARSWRLGLRRGMLAEISGLGRGLALEDGDGYAVGMLGPQTGGGGGRRSGGRYDGPRGEIGLEDSGASFDEKKPAPAEGLEEESEPSASDERRDGGKDAEADSPAPEESDAPAASPAPVLKERMAAKRMVSRQSANEVTVDADQLVSGATGGHAIGWKGDRLRGGFGGGKPVISQEAGQSWLGQQLFQRFPGLAGPAAPLAPAPDVPWDAEIKTLLASVSEPPTLAAGADARLEFDWKDGAVPTEDVDPTPLNSGRALVAPDRWFVHTTSPGAEPYDQWFSADRGVLATGTRLGRRRPGAEGDRGAWTPFVATHRIDFARNYPKWTARIASREGAVVVVELSAPGEGKERLAVTIDAEKHVVLLLRTFQGEKLVGSRRWGGLKLAGGLWWATEEANLDADGRETWKRALAVREVPAAEFDAALAKSLAGQEDVIFLGPVDPTLADAKQAVHEARGTFADHLTLAADHVAFQRWDDAWAAWDKARALVDTKAQPRSGTDWIEATLLSMSRRGERFAAHLTTLAKNVADRGGPAAHGLARLVDQLAQGGLQANERLTLLDVLAKAGDAGEEPAEKRWRTTFWTQQRAGALANAGRYPEAVAIWRALWKERPTDPTRCLALMNGLVNSGDVDGALELFGALDLSAARARDYQIQQAYHSLANVLWNANRHASLVAAADRYLAVRADDTAAYVDRLSALLQLERIEEFDRWIAENLTAAPVEGDAAASARLHAAVSLALGNDRSGQWYGDRGDPKWVRPLALLARRLARDDKADFGLLGQIVGDYRWQRTDGRRELMAWLREDVVAPGAVESLAPPRLAQLLAWLPWDRNSVDAAVWRGVTDRAKTRLVATTDDEPRRQMLAIVLALLDAHLEPDEAVAVLRAELAAASPARAPEVAESLLSRLVRTPWTQAMEDEAFALVPRLVAAETPPDARRAQFAGAARWIVERLSAVRVEAALPPQVEREKLPRASLRARQAVARTETRRALAARLASEVKGAPDLLRPWYEIERLCLAAELGEDPKSVEGEARELLLSQPEKAAEDVSVDGRLTWILRERSVLVLSYLAVRREAPEGLADRVLALLKERLAKDEKSPDRRYDLFRLLVALDRPAELEAALRAWIVPGEVESRSRRALGYVLAETGRLKEAAAEFEEVARLDEMGESEYVMLAAWYLVLGDAPRREDALERRYATVNEYVLNNRVQAESYRVQSRGRDGVPPTMDDEVLRVVRAALAKSSQPAGVLWGVQSLYRSTKDFRLLASVADGVIGHTPQNVYPFLTAAWGVLQEVHEEATCDEVRARLEARLPSAKTDTDRRALALLMVLVERRAAEVLNQPGPHVERALADLVRARKGAWLPGERRLMAEFLASLGKIPHAPLAVEQVAQLAALHGLEPKGGVDRLRIAHALWRTQWEYGRRDEALDGLAASLDEHRQAAGGVLPPETNDLADALTNWQEALARYGAGETWLAAETARQTSPAQRQWYARRTFQLWVRCLENGGTVSLGAGDVLYRAARGPMERALVDHAPDRLAEIVAMYCSLHRAAHNAKVKGVGDDLVRFSRTLFVEALPRFGQQATDQVRQVAETIHDIAGPLAALTLAVERLEAEPAWRAVRGRGYGAWQTLGYRMADWRREQPAIGALEPRLLAVVLRELERDLLSEEDRGRSFCMRHQSGFWSEKAEDFARVARKVVAANSDAPGRLHYAASYLWHGLELRDEAIRTLEDADLRGALREDGRIELVRWLQELKRFAASLPHAERLVAERPDNLEYRLVNIRALHAVERDADGKALIDATRAHFADLQTRRLIAPGAHSQLADLCLECGWFDRAVALYADALSEHRRSAGGGGDGELSRLYGALARALSGLGRFDEAVDAASSAVVAWGPYGGDRGGALQSLRDVLGQVPDLAAWTTRWEAQAAASGMDAPVVRLALADLHLQRKEPDAALRHLLVARRHTPDDAAVHASIVRAYEMKKDAAGVCDALATSLQQLPNQPDLYVKLAELLRGLGRADDAERALTGLAEYDPNDAEGHRRLAAARTQAGRHDDAAVQWRQVVRIRPTEVEGRLDLARSLARAGRKDEARAVLDELLRAKWAAGRRNDVEQVAREIDAK